MASPSLLLTGASTLIEGLRWQSESMLQIGRINNLDIVLNDASISRRHAEVVASQRGWVVRDMGSTNGTFVNGRRVVQQEQVLRDGDLLVCGNLAMKVNLVQPRSAEPTSATIPIDDMHEPPRTEPRGNDLGSGPRIRTSGSVVKVQATTQRTWEQAVEGLGNQGERRLRQEQHFLTLLRAGYHLTHVASLDELLQSLLEETVTVLDAQRGAIVLYDAVNGQLVLRALSIAKKHVNAARSFSTTLAQRCFSEGDSFLCRDANTDQQLSKAGSVANGSMASIVCALLRSPRKRLGVLHLDRGPTQEAFTPEEFYLADAIAASMSVGIECAQLVEEQRNMFLQTVTAMARAVELRDLHTGNHTHRVAAYALLLARELKLPPQECQHIEVGTPLHDIGKIAIDDAILRKPGKLTEAEFEQMKLHTIKGAAILQNIPGLAPMIPIVRHHHERWDGRGYPDGLAGATISRLARIVAVTDAFDAMTSDRPYRTGMPAERAFAELRAQSGSHFDPECVEAFLHVRQHVEALLHSGKPADPVVNFMATVLTPHPASSAHHETNLVTLS